MVSTSEIEDWIREIEGRPASAPAIIRAIAARLSELDSWNEELLTDNIDLRSGNRVAEYEQRIHALENQLEMLKRQMGSASQAAFVLPQTAQDILLFHPRGGILKIGVPPEVLSGTEICHFLNPFNPQEPQPGIVVTDSSEELLLVFDSGRTISLAVSKIPPASFPLDWNKAYPVQLRPGEDLVALFPITSLALYDYCVQISRKGCAKLMSRASFQALISKGSIGAGIKRRPDKTVGLIFANRDDPIILASHEGAIFSLPVTNLPYSVDEIVQLPPSDHIVSILNPNQKSTLLVFTNLGKIVHRDATWIEPAASFKTRGQMLFSASRREAGVRLVGAAGVNGPDRCVVLVATGEIIAFQASNLLTTGSIGDGSAAKALVSAAVFGKRP